MEGLAELAFRRHHAQIYRYLRRKTGDADRAEDLAQEVFADAASALARGDWRPASMLAWLYTIAQRRFADEVRRRRHSYNGVPLDDLLDDVPAPDYGAGLARALGEAISRLSPAAGHLHEASPRLVLLRHRECDGGERSGGKDALPKGTDLSPRRSRAAGHRHLKPGAQELRLDREVLDLLRHDPELLAIADAVAATQLRAPDGVPNTTLAERELGAEQGAVPE